MHIHNIKLYNIIKNSLNDGDDFFLIEIFYFIYYLYFPILMCYQRRTVEI